MPIKELFQDGAADRRGLPGMIASLQTYGDDPIRFHPHIHNLIRDGLVSPEGSLVRSNRRRNIPVAPMPARAG